MNERRKIEERLRKKEEEIRALEAQIRDARIYVQALQDVLKLLPRGPERSMTSSALRSGSGVAKARECILSKGEPAHILELLRALGKEPTREAKASLAGSLAAYVRKGEVFTRPGPNIFGLIELRHENKTENDLDSDEPPPEFGMDAAAE
jgi:hypothetical protein